MTNVTARNPRPRTVAIGAGVCLLFSAVDLVLGWLQPGVTPGLMAFLAVSQALPIGAALAAYFGRNWGRILLLILWVGGMLLSAFIENGWSAISVAFAVITGVALALLFLPLSNQWYREELKRAW